MNLDMIRTILLSVLFLFSVLQLNAQCDATISGGGEDCIDQTITVTFTLEGTAPWSVVYSIGGVSQPTLELFDSPTDIPIEEPGTVELISVTDDTGCNGAVSGSAEVFFYSPIVINCGNYELNCNSPSVAINCDITGGNPAYSYQWAGPNSFISSDQNPMVTEPGIYQLTVTDANGCTATEDVVVAISPIDILCVMTGDLELSCLNPEVELTITCTGGVAPYTFLWSNGAPTVTTIVNNPGIYSIIVTDANGCSWSGLATVTESTEGCGLIKGNIVNDLNLDCANDAGDEPLKHWLVRATGNGVFYGISDSDGYYEIDVAVGDYEVEIVNPSQGIWMSCTPLANVNIFDTNDVAEVDFQLQALIDCPLMEVDISSPLYRRCFDNKHHVSYCNKGTIPAEDVSIEVFLDTDFVVNSTSHPYTSPSAGVYVFEIADDVAVGDCGTITINSTLSCDAVLGETLCSEAHVFPDTLCAEPDPLWSGASLEISSECTPTEVLFIISNVGDGNMVSPANYIVIQDGVMANTTPQEVQLPSGDDTMVSYPADGSTYIMLLDQVAYHPGQSMPTLAIEGCGTNPAGGFSTGFVTQFPEDDANPFISIDCQVVIGSFDPNDKYGYPAGYGDEHFIDLGQNLEYRIRFQNTGTDTAFKVVIQDVLSPHLDIASLQPGTSSHPYELSILGRDTLVFTFNDIMLPDSNINELASHGFVKFRIQQAALNELGDEIENEAAIFFDFNDPVITNKTIHRLGDHYIISSAFEPQRPDIQHSIQPNPASGEAILSLIGQVPQGQMTIRFFDIAGHTVQLQQLFAPVGKLDLNGLRPGLYFYEITIQEGMVGMGKMVVE